MLSNLTQPEMLSIGLVSLLFLFISYRFGAFFSARKSKKEMERLENDSHSTHKSLKRILEEEKNTVVQENEQLKVANSLLEDRIEEYRKKLAGMGVLSFSGSKRRSDILYSLLLENEALEQLIAEQGEKLAGERREYLMHRMKDIRKRQRLLAEIFNDDTIKNYVKEVLSDESKIEDAVHRLEDKPETEQTDESDHSKEIPATTHS